MLQKLNEGIQGVLAWVIIILVSVTFALFGVDYYLQSRHSSNNVITVNDQPISKQELEIGIRRARQAFDPATKNRRAEQEIQRQVIDSLVSNIVSVQAAKENGFSINDQQANAAILNIPQFQEDGHFSAQRYQQALGNALYTPESFQKQVRQGMLLNQQRFAFIGTSMVLPNEVKRFVKLYMQTRDYDYVSIPAKAFINEVSISDTEAQSYYQQHLHDFIAPEKVSVRYVRLSMNDIKSKINVTDAQVKQYYEDNKSNFTTPAKWHVAHILFSVPKEASSSQQQAIEDNAVETHLALTKDPSLFTETVKARSDDKISASQGGVLPWIEAGQTKLDKTLVLLTKPGDISEPVRTKHGYEIFKLIEYKAPQIKPFAKVRDEIAQQLVAEQAQAKYTQALEELSDLSYQTPDTLKPVADALNLKIQQSTPFSRQGGDTPLTKNTQVVQAAFSHDVLELENNSEPMQIDDDSVVVLRVSKHIPKKQKPFQSVKATIMDTLKMQKARDKARQLGEQILQQSFGTKEQTKLMNSANLKWQSVKGAMRETDNAPQTINQLAFNIAKSGLSKGENIDKEHYAVVFLKGIHDGQLKALDKEEVDSIKQQLEASNGVMTYDLYLSYLLNKANIVNMQQ